MAKSKPKKKNKNEVDAEELIREYWAAIEEDSADK
jgi:hypothetical protein